MDEVHAIGYSWWAKKAKSGYEITTPTAGVFQDTPAISVRESEEGVSKWIVSRPWGEKSYKIKTNQTKYWNTDW